MSGAVWRERRLRATAHEILDSTIMMIPLRRAAAERSIDPALTEDLHHEMGNTASHRFPLRHGNHDVHCESVTGTRRPETGEPAGAFPFPVKIRVLGSAAGGGFPQWNCNCPNCAGLRRGTVRARARTQSSIAVSGTDDEAWALVNASPDILAQIQAHPVLQPGRAIRDTAIVGVVLVDGQVDHTTGLYMLREAGRPLTIWCTDSTYADLTRGNPVLHVLGHFCGVDHHRIGLDEKEFTLAGVSGLSWRAMPVNSKPAPYSPNRESPVPGDNIALVLTDDLTGRSVLYAPGLCEIDDRIWRAMNAASCVLVDGTFWTDAEMIALGISRKRARDIGHLPQSGAGGMLEWLARLPAGTRKVLIHINNTNPILDEDSEQRAELERRGVEVAWDGMEIRL
jgi:pyrroloquinoline quinone biosynthesis protein B